LTDFFIASLADLNRLDNQRPADGPLSAVVDSELDLLMLCNLESILTGTEWESVFDRDYINPVRDDGPDGPWIYEVSNCLLEALRNLGPDDLLACAEQWAESDEWTLRQDASREKIADVLRELSGLAARACKYGKTLFICTEP
jgi:hypothetical protein